MIPPEVLTNALTTIIVGATAALGGIINSYAAKVKRDSKDFNAAAEKIRAVYARLGLDPGALDSLDDVFSAIRRINAELDKRGTPP